jgi:hypothetical protein
MADPFVLSDTDSIALRKAYEKPFSANFGNRCRGRRRTTKLRQEALYVPAKLVPFAQGPFA